MPLHIFLSTWAGTSLGALEAAKIAKDVVLVAGLSLALAASVRQPWFRDLVKDRLLWLIGAYGLLTLVLAVAHPTHQEAEVVGVVYNLRFFLFFIYGLLITRLFDAQKLRQAALKIVLVVGSVVVLFGLLQYLVLPHDLLRHVGYSREHGVVPMFFIDDKPDLPRVMSTIRDPNSLGSYLIIIGPLAAGAFLAAKKGINKWLLAGLLVATLVCVGLTFSRSAWLGFALALVSFVFLASHKFKQALVRRKKQLAIICAAAVVLMIGSLFAFRNTYFVQNVIIHADDSTELEDPNQLRVRFFRESLKEIASNPLGTGPGTAGLASIRDPSRTELNENYYLQIASEAGILGLALFLTILVMVALRLYKIHRDSPIATAILASFIGLALTNFLVHIWSNEAVAYTWWGLAGLWIGTRISKK